jgi:Prophage minor tail protein Z (GPZ)
MAKIFVRHNFSRVALALKGISGKTLQKAVSRSIKRASKTVAKVASQEIRKRRLINMKAGTLKKKIKIFDHASPSKSVTAQYGEVHLSGRPENLARFYAKAVSAGKGVKRVIVSEKGRPYLEQDKAFMVQRGTAAKKVILVREGAKRLPVHKLTGPSLGKLASDSGMLGQLQAVAEERLEKEVSHNLEFYLEQAVNRAKGK